MPNSTSTKLCIVVQLPLGDCRCYPRPREINSDGTYNYAIEHSDGNHTHLSSQEDAVLDSAVQSLVQFC